MARLVRLLSTRWRSPALEAVLLLAVALLAIAVLRVRSTSQCFTIDESGWISTSRYFWIAFVERDLFGPSWAPNYVVLTQPPVARYLTGFGLWLQGWRDDQLNGRYDILRSASYNARAGTVPSRELLAAARRVTFPFAVGAMVLVYAAGRLLAGRLAGLGAVLLGRGDRAGDSCRWAGPIGSDLARPTCRSEDPDPGDIKRQSDQPDGGQ